MTGSRATIRRIVDRYWFVRAHPGDFATPAIDVGEAISGPVVFEGIDSRIVAHPRDPEIVSKLIFPRSMPRDGLRRYINCQAKREYRSTARVARLGLEVPEVLGYAVAVNPAGPYDSILFMRRLPAHRSLKEWLRTGLHGAERRRLLEKTGREFAALYANGLHHNDSHFGNIVLTGSGRSIWLDNDVRHPVRERVLHACFLKALDQLARHSHACISADEWRLFVNSLFAALEGTVLGSRLAMNTPVPGRGAAPVKRRRRRKRA